MGPPVLPERTNRPWRRRGWSAAELEQACGALAAADAHRDHAVTDFAALHLVGDRADEAGAGHAEGVADRDRAAVDVEFFGVDAELVAAVDHLHREGFVELPQSDVSNFEAVTAE